jgi:hypothetical protein
MMDTGEDIAKLLLNSVTKANNTLEWISDDVKTSSVLWNTFHILKAASNTKAKSWL